MADFNNDGKLDIIRANDIFPGGTKGRETEIFIQGQTPSEFSLSWKTSDSYWSYAVDTGDIDDDGLIDFVIGTKSNQPIVVFKNISDASPSETILPPILRAVEANAPGAVQFSWASSDAGNPNLTFRLRIGTFSGGSDILSAASAAGLGLLGIKTSHTITLPAGTYFWSAQTVSARGFAISDFAPEESFVLIGGQEPPFIRVVASIPDYMSNSGEILPIRELDLLMSNNPLISCLSEKTCQKSQDEDKLHIDLSKCPSDTKVDLVVRPPLGFLRNSNGVFPCALNLTLSDILSTQSVFLCELTTPKFAGDANGDGLIDLKDLGKIKNEFGKSPDSADFNLDGKVDLKDLGIVKKHFNLKDK